MSNSLLTTSSETGPHILVAKGPVNGKDMLSITVERDDGTSRGVEIAMPADMETIQCACSTLIDSLAGVSRAQLEMRAIKAIIDV